MLELRSESFLLIEKVLLKIAAQNDYKEVIAKLFWYRKVRVSTTTICLTWHPLADYFLQWFQRKTLQVITEHTISISETGKR